MNFPSLVTLSISVVIIGCNIVLCMRNFALGKSPYQSSTYWDASYAVDGNTNGRNPETFNTCSATKPSAQSSYHTWEVNISFPIIVKNITVYGRTDQADDQLSNFELYLRNHSGSNQSLRVKPSGYNVYIINPANRVAQFVSLTRYNNILTLCEVIVEGECPDGLYSEKCNQPCGKCYDPWPCDKETGECFKGCERGWKGERCDEECNIGTYGYGCNETCGNCLNGNRSCSKTDGHCLYGCEPGWQDKTCKQECNIGTYGHGCNETCGNCLNGNLSCSKSDGQCRDGCQVGWTDKTCKLEKLQASNLPDNKTVVIAVVTSVTFFVILIAVVVVLSIRRIRRRPKEAVPRRQTKEQTTFHTRGEEDIRNDSQVQPNEVSVPSDGTYENTNKRALLMAQRIPVISFWAHVVKKKRNKAEYESEFQELTHGLSKAHEASLANPSKNRYKSMYPYDFNRVVLKRNSTKHAEYVNNLDYINASHIKGYGGRKHYIAAQGPINQTVDDFWYMVWQEKTKCIVMLTNLLEIGKVKCIQYWPDVGERMYGEVTVKTLCIESYQDHVKRDLEISVGDRSMNVTQFHYNAWPDKDVPDTAWSLVGFWKAVRKHKVYRKSPMVVHCSAGVGRTGTFIALDILYDEACANGYVSVIKCVDNLREQRVNMVQTANQYLFLHEAVAEALGVGTMPVYHNQFAELFRYLMEKDENSGITRLQRQNNMLMNVDLGQTDNNCTPIYLNALNLVSENTYLPNLSGKDAYILIKWTSDEQIITTVWQSKVKSVINLDSRNAKDTLSSLEVNQSKPVAGLNIICNRKGDFGAIEEKHFTITGGKKTESIEVAVFLLKTWEESHGQPHDSVTTLTENINQWHSNSSASNQILLYSRFDVNRCGLVYILLIEKDRIRMDGQIHVLQTTVDMLSRNTKLLPTFEQYVFIHKALTKDAVPESTYENTIPEQKRLLNDQQK